VLCCAVLCRLLLGATEADLLEAQQRVSNLAQHLPGADVTFMVQVSLVRLVNPPADLPAVINSIDHTHCDHGQLYCSGKSGWSCTVGTFHLSQCGPCKVLVSVQYAACAASWRAALTD
jgi:hypothetical protein